MSCISWLCTQSEVWAAPSGTVYCKENFSQRAALEQLCNGPSGVCTRKHSCDEQRPTQAASPSGCIVTHS